MRMLDFARVDFGQEEIGAVNKVMSGYWLASGSENENFEKEFANCIGTKYAICVNSGSSANLLSLKSLNLPKGSKVLSSSCGFPATLSPIIHCGLEPVLVDYDINTHNIDVDQVIEQMPNIKAAIFAHTMGSPVDMKRIMAEANKYGVKVIEDCCEAAGSKIGDSNVGALGTLGTFSFYPSHQITALGGGGMITTDDKNLANELRSLRDWGKIHDWDEQYLVDNKTQYSTDVGGMKYFKHYTYQTLGFNMKLPEANAAFGREQLKKLTKFTERRIENYNFLTEELGSAKESFIDIKTVEHARPSWFGFILTLKDTNLSRDTFSEYLEANNVRTRPFFAGNITKHDPFKMYEKDYPVADKLMRDSLFIGIWQGLGKEELKYMSDTIKNYLSSRKV